MNAQLLNAELLIEEAATAAMEKAGKNTLADFMRLHLAGGKDESSHKLGTDTIYIETLHGKRSIYMIGINLNNAAKSKKIGVVFSWMLHPMPEGI